MNFLREYGNQLHKNMVIYYVEGNILYFTRRQSFVFKSLPRTC